LMQLFFLFMHYVYILLSHKDGSYYKGYSENPIARLNQHNEGKSRYTSFKCPWKLIHMEMYSTKSEALKRERSLKKYSHAQIEVLVRSSKNILNELAETNPQQVGD
jgi:putative endonuclease